MSVDALLKKIPSEIVGVGNTTIKNPIVDNHSYQKLDGNAHFVTKPSVVHFGGYKVQMVHSQLVEVINVSKHSQRIDILQPTTPFFKFVCTKKGVIAPGMSEEIRVEFLPTEWRYYYDNMRIHAMDENLLIPIHAYPVVNDVIFPKNIDLGVCPLFETTVKTVQLQCKVPIQFEYSIVVFEPHADFIVSPLQGVIPANGHVVITIQFRPSRMAVATTRIRVNVSQFNFKPLSCLITGSAGPGVTRELGLRELERAAGPSRFPLETFETSATVNMKKNDFQRESLLSFDNITPAEPGQKIELKFPTMPEPPADMEFEGIRVPHKLESHSAVQYVLTQEPGKLKINDVKKVLAGKGPPPEASRTKSHVTTIDESFHDIEADDAASRQLREIEFEKNLRKREEFEKAKEVKWFIAIGQHPMTEEEKIAVRNSRINRRAAAERRKRASERSRLISTTTSSRPAHYVAPSPTSPTSSPPRKRSQTAVGGEGDVVAGAGVPKFDPYENDVWARRGGIVSKFLKEVHKVIVTQRVNARIKAVMAKMAEGGENQEKVGALLAGTTSKREDEKMTIPPLKPEFVQEHLFPAYREVNFVDRTAVDVLEVEPFTDWAHLDLKVPSYYKLMGYEAIPLMPTPLYVPTEKDRELRVGALEEQGVRGRRGAMEVAPVLPVPEVCKPVEPPPPHPCRALEPTPVYPATLPFSEVDLVHSLRPYIRDFPIVQPPRLGSVALTTIQNAPKLTGSFRVVKNKEAVFAAPLPVSLLGPVTGEVEEEDDDDGEYNIVRDPPTAEEVSKEYLMPPPVAGDVPQAGGGGDAAAQQPAPVEVPPLDAEAIASQHTLNVAELALEAHKRELREKMSTLLPEYLEDFNSHIVVDEHKLLLS